MKTTKKTPCLKPRTATINVGLMIMFILFLVGNASAWTSSTFSENKELTLEKESLTKYGTYNYKIEGSKKANVTMDCLLFSTGGKICGV